MSARDEAVIEQGDGTGYLERKTIVEQTQLVHDRNRKGMGVSTAADTWRDILFLHR